MAHYDVSTSQKKTNPELVAGGTLYSDAPVGCVLAFCGVIAPSGWFICDGSELNRDDFPELFNVIGTAFGNGDGIDTFNLPDLRNKFLEGASATNPIGTEKSAGLPNIKGNANFRSGPNQYSNFTDVNNAFKNSVTKDSSTSPFTTFAINESVSSYKDTLKFNANDSNSIYSDSVNTVQPPAVCANYIIKAQQTALPLDIENQVETAAETYIEQKLKGVLEYTLTVGGQWENYTTNHMVIRFVDEESDVDLRISFADIVQGSSQTYNTIGQTSEGRQINIFRGAIGSNIVYVSIAGTSTDHIKCYGCDF